MDWPAAMADLCGGPLVPWLPMPGRSWPGAAAWFVAMWAAMMIPMMLPSLMPALWRYGETLADAAAARWTVLVATAAAGYFFVWLLVGLAMYPLVVLFAGAHIQGASAVIVVTAGLMQLTRWKRRQLGCCGAVESQRAGAAIASNAWVHGMQLGTQCARCCGNLMLVLVVTDVMNLAAMAAIAAVVTLERLPAIGVRAAQASGVAIAAAGLLMLARLH